MSSTADDWRRFTKNAAGGCMIGAPLLLTVSGLLSTGIYSGDSEVRYLASIAENEALYYASGMVGVLGAVLLVGAILGLIHLVRTHHPRFAIGAGALALLGGLTFAGVYLSFTVVDFELANADNRAAMVTLLQDTEDSAAAIPFFVTWIGTFLGIALLAGGLLRSHAVPRWMPGLLIVGMVLLFVSEESWMGVIAGAVVLAAMGAIGLTALRSSVGAWEAGELAGEPPMAPAPPPSPVVAAH